MCWACAPTRRCGGASISRRPAANGRASVSSATPATSRCRCSTWHVPWRRSWRTVSWRDGTKGRLSSRFARVRVRAANDDLAREEEWLVIEWPHGEAEPTPLLAVDVERKDLFQEARLQCHGALDDRTRLRGAQIRSSASRTTKVATGAASIITPHCASPPTAS